MYLYRFGKFHKFLPVVCGSTIRVGGRTSGRVGYGADWIGWIGGLL